MVIDIKTIKEVKDRIGLLCQQHRKANNLSRDELAKTLGVSPTTIQNIEQGKNATLDNVLKIANHFGLLATIYNSLDQFTVTDKETSFY